VRHTATAAKTTRPERASGWPFHRMKLLLSRHNVRQIYPFESKKCVKCLQAFAAANANDVAFAFNLGDKDTRLRLEALQLLRHHTEVDIPSVNTVFFEFKSLSARLSISDRFGLDGNFDSSVGLFLSNLNSDANALF
jgi:hypothetical protein